MEKKADKGEKKKKHPILEDLEDKIAFAYHRLSVLNACIKDRELSKMEEVYYWRYRYALHQIEVLNAENTQLIKENEELSFRLLNERTPDAYMDAVATALAMLPISSIRKVYETTLFQEKTIKKAADTLGLVATKEAKDEARQYMKDCGLEDIDKRGGHNRKAVEMLVNGKVVATFDSASDAGRATNNKNTILDRIKSGSIIDGVQFRYKKTN